MIRAQFREAADIIETSDRLPELSRLVNDASSFLADVFDHSAAVYRGRGLEDVATLEDFDRLLDAGWLQSISECSLVMTSKTVDRASYEVSATPLEREEAGKLGGRLVDPDKLLAGFNAGATIRLRRCDRHFPAVRALCAGLGRELGHGVRANTYITPPGEVGLRPHYDPRDVFVVQTAGHKRWELWQPETPNPLPEYKPANDPTDRDRDPDLEVVMGPGDVLYFPRGWTHRVTGLDEVSMHLTLTVRRLTYWHIAAELLDGLLLDTQLREGLPVRFADHPDHLADIVEIIRTRLDSHLEEFTDEAAGRAIARLQESTFDDGPRPRLVEAAVNLNAAATRVRLAEGVSVEHADAGVIFRRNGVPIDVPDVVRAPLARLADGGAIGVSELAPSLHPMVSRRIGEKLVKAGILAEATRRT